MKSKLLSPLLITLLGLASSPLSALAAQITVVPLIEVTNDAIPGPPDSFRAMLDSNGDISEFRYDTVPDFSLTQIAQGVCLLSRAEPLIGSICIAKIQGSIDPANGGSASLRILREGGFTGFDYRHFPISMSQNEGSWQVYGTQSGSVAFDTIDLKAMRDDNGDADGIETITLSRGGNVVQQFDTGSLGK